MDKLKELWSYVLIVVVVLLIRTFIVSPVRVDGNSMLTTLKNGETLLLKKYDKKLERFDIIVFTNGKDKLIKRVIGLPGEHVEYKDNKLYINGEEVEDGYAKNDTNNFSLKDICYSCEVIPKDKYLVLGDNREISADSRSKELGLVSKNNITGKAVFRLWPLNKFGLI